MLVCPKHWEPKALGGETGGEGMRKAARRPPKLVLVQDWDPEDAEWDRKVGIASAASFRSATFRSAFAPALRWKG